MLFLRLPPLWLLVAMIVLSGGAQELLAHGPGRSLRVETGFCAPESLELRNEQNLEARFLSEPVPFCFRVRNLEAFPVVLRLRFLPGHITEKNNKVCVLTHERTPVTHKNFFWQMENKCQNLSLLLDPAASKDILGQWIYHPGGGSPQENNANSMVSCVLGEASPLAREELSHLSDVHIKGKRSMNMVFIQGTHGMQSSPSQEDPTFQESDPACDPVTPLLSDNAKKKLLSPSLPKEKP
ncbi:MAG: hypothetical protein H7839_10955 [Magnetococcus sp. YQC-5]